ncbi:MAG: hypothetical protein KBA31_17255 [Alphaproteobacteria bacterium]|nr:hypothetical protein [Alphaproteobacteria bacterium]
MSVSALFAAAMSAAVIVSPCDVVSKQEVEKLLHGRAVDLPSSEIGEETAPSCLWATAGRHTEMKLSIWSKDELPVVSMPDAASYFVKLKAEEAGAIDLPIGDRAFASAPGRDVYGRIVIVKGEKLFTFEYARVNAREARAFAARVMSRI